MLCGIGDVLSHITRFPAMQEIFPDYKLKVFLGGFGRSPQFMKEILELETFGNDNIEVSIIKNLTYHSQLPGMEKFIQDNVMQEGDIFQNWSFCHEIFQNQKPIFMQYKMTEGFDYEYGYHSQSNKENFEVTNNRIVAIQPLTKSGNAEGFESDVAKGRFWSLENWQKICDRLHEDGFTIGFTGFGDEDWGLSKYCFDKGYDIVNFVGQPISDTFFFLNKCAGHIATNSWTWEITSRSFIPTVCMYTKNHFFIQNHMPDGKSKIWDTTYIETNNAADPEDVYDIWKQMYDNKKRPKGYYSVCMITMDDEDCVVKTDNNVMQHRPYEFIIVDGGSKDKTIDLLGGAVNTHIDYSGGKGTEKWVYENKWNDNFEEQKNYALGKATSEWRVWIDADETYESLFWNQLPWYIWVAEKHAVDCLIIPRINTISGLNDAELSEYINMQGWKLSGFNWVNYPDAQQRVFKSNCKFIGRTHERIIGCKKEMYIPGVHILHPKTKARQERGLERENKSLYKFTV